MWKKTASLAILASLLAVAAALAGVSGSGTSSAIDGVIGVTPVQTQTCLAVFIPVSSGQALSGLKWYNNDGTVAFPHVLLASGAGEDPTPLAEATAVADDVAGQSSDWSEVAFSEPVASASTGLYAIFQLPTGSEQQALGAGGGAGIGYRASGGLAAWVSLDGTEWVRLHESYSLAVVPQFVTVEAGMTVMSKRLGTAQLPMEAPSAATALLPARPNPFNPQTELRFTLRQTGTVDLAIYDVRGARVRSLLQDERGAGEHLVVWRGEDDGSRLLPSGVYVVRLKADGQVQSQRLMLVK